MGIPKQLVASDIKPELICAICNDLFYKPMIMSCGHVYCKTCLIESSICPADGKPLIHASYFPTNSVFFNVYNSLFVTCPEANCSEVLQIAQLDKHSETVHSLANSPIINTSNGMYKLSMTL